MLSCAAIKRLLGKQLIYQVLFLFSLLQMSNSFRVLFINLHFPFKETIQGINLIC